jgi:multidrug efflux pump subunit AcrA (membrane-fusion protein)
MADSSPRFRHDLLATAVEVDGIRCVDVRDPDRDVSFRFYDFEYDLAQQLDGRPAADISDWAIATYGLDLTPVVIAEFAARLSELGFLVTEGDQAPDPLHKPDRATLGGFPPPGPPVPLLPPGGPTQPEQRSEDESQPVSQVVNRAVERAAEAGSELGSIPTMIAAASPSAPTTLVLPGGLAPTAGGRRPSSELPLLGDPRAGHRSTPIGGSPRTTATSGSPSGSPRVTPVGGSPRITPASGARASATTLAAVPRWMAELDSTATRPGAPTRDPFSSPSSSPSPSAPPSPASPPVGETMVGFAAVTEAAVKPTRETSIDPPEAMGTVMGFAAVTDSQIRDAEQAAARISHPPQGTSERRLPPRPEHVVMAPFQAEEARRRPPEAGLRRPARYGADRSTMIVVLVVALAVIGAVIAYYIWSQYQSTLEARRVRIIAPHPAAVYRWFDATGSAVVGGSAALGFAAGGSVADVLPPGSRYAAGEIIAKLEGAADREGEVNRARSRVAYHQQIRDGMRAAGNIPEMRKAEIKIVEKQALLDEAEAALDRLVIRANESGEVADVVANRGTLVEANAPVVRVRTGALRGEFVLAARDTDAAAHLGFCRVEIVGIAPAGGPDGGAIASGGINAAGAAVAGDSLPRFADCKLVPPAQPPSDHFEVELPESTGILLGQPLRLARVRYDGVFPVPRSAVVRVGDTDRVFVVGPGDIALARAITIADSDADDVVVSQGVDVGDRVIVDPPGDLRDGSPLTILH